MEVDAQYRQLVMPAGRPEGARLIVNVDVPDLAQGEAFYCAAFGLAPGHRLVGAVELLGLDAPLYLLERPAGSDAGAGARDYARHWTPVHLDLVVDDVDIARDRALRAGARDETGVQVVPYGRIAALADPFGHGFCLIQFNPEGYDAVTA